jgi:metal-responsive CopG/Arc/MetJ family transcriptional regulator
MKQKTSVTLDSELLSELDRLAGQETSRSRLVERAIEHYVAWLRREEREARDRMILDQVAEDLNAEAEDVLTYQVIP